MKKFIILNFFVLSFVLNSMAQETSESPDAISQHNNSILTKSDSSKLNETTQTKTPIYIFYKPNPAYPKSENGTICFQGTVSLRVEFLKTGEIGKISPIKELPYGATENAIVAAKQIVFEPATVNGKYVTTVKTIQFSFTIY